MSTHRSPSRVRDMLENRIRKLSRTYSTEVQYEAVQEAIDLLMEYRIQLVAKLDTDDEES
jgi:hypothetical protein